MQSFISAFVSRSSEVNREDTVLETLEVFLFVGFTGSEGCAVTCKWLLETIENCGVLLADFEVFSAFGPIEFVRWCAVLTVIQGMLSHEKQVELFDDLLRSLLRVKYNRKLPFGFFKCQ